MSRSPLLTGLACVLVCLSGNVRAEVSLGIVSDYRYRGISLTDGDPALQAGVGWDHDEGWYAGLFAASTHIGGERGLQAVSYLGRAWRLDSGRSWEAGIQHIAFTSRTEDNYRELYLGLASDRWSARIYHQPKPFGDYGPTAYAEVNASIPLGGRWLLLGHAGAAWRGGDLYRYVDRVHYDGSVGVGVAVGAFNLRLQRVMTEGRGDYLAGDPYSDTSDDGWVFGATWTW